jgi:hypothetical protein
MNSEKQTVETKDSVLVELKRLCYNNRKFITKITLEKERFEELRWDIYEWDKLWNNLRDNYTFDKVTIYGIEITHD